MKTTPIIMATIGMLALCVGCERKQTSSPAPTPGPEPSAEIEAKLAKADAYDGETDKIVSKCTMCGLAMDGSDAHQVTSHGYTIYFCSEGCKEHFSEDADAAILALKIPEKE